jgi:hypothetical protein
MENQNEQPQVEQFREITATDHVNKHMLDAFKNFIESGKFQLKETPDDGDEWESEDEEVGK